MNNDLPADTRPLFLIAGPAVPETIRLPARNQIVQTVGGVGAQLASALSTPKRPAILAAALPRTAPAKQAADILRNLGVAITGQPAQHGATEITIDAYGEAYVTYGSWPETPAITGEFARRLPQAACLLIATEPTADTIGDYLKAANTNAVPSIVVVSAIEKLPNLLAVSHIRKSIVALNHLEFTAASAATQSRDHLDFLTSQHAQALFITHAADGWTLHRPGLPDLHSPAPPPPDGAILLGCGDWAAAGLAEAIAQRLSDQDLIAHVNRRISDKIKSTADAASTHPIAGPTAIPKLENP